MHHSERNVELGKSRRAVRRRDGGRVQRKEGRTGKMQGSVFYSVRRRW